MSSNLIQALGFSSDPREALQQIDDKEWRKLLPLCDALQLTLLIGHIGRGHLPEWVAERIDQNYSDNCRRFERLQLETAEVVHSLRKSSIDSTVLKGFTHWDHFISDPALRNQGDIDIWCRPNEIYAARDVLRTAGYRSVGRSKGRHLDPMIREKTWAWTGDYFAPDLPIPVDLHFQLWDQTMERLEGPGEAAMWDRRAELNLAAHVAGAQLDLVDAVSFAALHNLMHLLHGDVRLQRMWELAYFLKKHCDDDAFWMRWQSIYTNAVRQMQVICFVLSDQWFGCGLPALITEEAATLPQNVRLWLRQYGSSPLQSNFGSNTKQELWLNLCLLHSPWDRVRLIARRLFPISLRGAAIEEVTPSRIGKTAGLIGRRATHHLAALPLAFVGGCAWSWRCLRLRRQLP